MYRLINNQMYETKRFKNAYHKFGGTLRQRQSKSRTIATFFARNAISLIALVVSLTSAYFSVKNYGDTVTQQAIESAYKTFYDINIHNINNSSLTHLNTMPDSYLFVKDKIHTALAPIDARESAAHLVKERAFANYLFSIFEQVFYQYNQAVVNNNKNRADFLREVLNYLTGRVLRNPRLLYLWDVNGGKLSTYYESATIEYYNQHVLHDSTSPLKETPDPVGPFYIDTVAN